MRRAVLLLAALSLSAGSRADGTAVHVRFGADAFNAAVPADAPGNAVFSPYSFEIGCVALSDAFDSITKAHFSETIGVLSDANEVYGDMMARIKEAAASTNGFRVLTARALCLPDVRMANVPYRRELQGVFSTEVCPGIPAKGAECWLKAAMDGEMEDFGIPIGTVSSGTYAAYDLVSVRFSWLEPFPLENSSDIQFRLADGSVRNVPAMCDLRRADMWRTRRFSMLRLPLADGAWFYALLPAEGLSLGDIRGEFTSERIDDLLAVMKSVTISGVSHGPVAIAVPKMDVTTETDLSDVFLHFKFPLKGFERMDAEMRPAAVRQRVRFRLDEQGLDPEPLVSKAPGAIVRADAETQRFALNRPFFFFIHHEPTGTIPVAGQFTGK